MLPSRTAVPARQAARGVLQTAAANARPLVSLSQHQSQPLAQRRYATAAPSVRRKALARPVPSLEGRLLFKPSDIPPIDIWAEYKSSQGLGDLTAEDALKTVINYCDVATQDTSSWKAALERDFNIDLYTLHYAALPLALRGQDIASHIGRHMLLTASNLGYIPSTLSLMRMLTGVPKQVFSRVKPAFRDAEAQFRRLVQAEKSPDAFTLQGLLLQQEGRADTYALNYFDKAIETAARNTPPSAEDQPKPAKQATPGVRSPRWAYEGTCHQQRGFILLRKGRTKEAVASFRIVALELDLADGHAELAKLLPRDAPERETCLLKAAQAGNFDACRLLALDLADKAADPALPKADRIGAGNMAHEWAQIEPDPTKREELGAQVADRTREVMGGKTFVRA